MSSDEGSQQFKRFIVVGLFATIFNYIIFLAFLSADINYLLSSSLGYIAGLIAGFIFNKKWTFKLRNQTNSIEVIKYITVYFLSLALSLYVLNILVNNMEIVARVANIFVIILTTITNFLGLKLYVFRK
jgi:putative flippase GtrA